MRVAAGLLALAAAGGFFWAGAVFGADSGEPAGAGVQSSPSRRPSRTESESPVVVDSPKYADFVQRARQAGLRRRPDSVPAGYSPAPPAGSGGGASSELVQ